MQIVKISVAIPLYNRKNFISETLISIMNQTYPVDEIVIVDDGSTDCPDDIIQSFPFNITYKKIKNSGPAIARKNAIEIASNEWIALCDSDDLWEPDHVKNFIDSLQKHSNIDYYFSNFKTTDSSVPKFEQAPANWLSSFGKSLSSELISVYPNDLDHILNFQPIFQSCLFFKKSSYYKVGGIDETLSRTLSEDLHLTLKFVCFTTGLANKNSSVTIRKHSDNFSANYIACLKGEITVLNKFLLEELSSVQRKKILSSIKTRTQILFEQIYWYETKEEFIYFYLKNYRYLIKPLFILKLCRKLLTRFRGNHPVK